MDDLTIVDYGAGNLRSVAKAFAFLGYEPHVTNEPSDLARARAVVLPGVGAAGQIMRSLRELELDEAVRDYVASGRPFLGVCMGLQVLMDWSEEDGGQQCLGLIGGKVTRLEVSAKVPHMGWNAVRQVKAHPVWDGIPDGSYFYFVHSYVVEPTERDLEAGVTEYECVFPSALAKENVFATQFHPEKSGRVGLQVYRNFVEWSSTLSRRST